MELCVIAAVSENGVIGADGTLPWHLPADLKRFKVLTRGHAVIMGRKTYESIGRPLPDRLNIVLSRDPGFANAPVRIARSWEAALQLAQQGGQTAFVIGGQALYKLALPSATRLYLTRVHGQVQGDARFPPVDWAQWRCTFRQEHEADADHALGFTFEEYERTPLPI